MKCSQCGADMGEPECPSLGGWCNAACSEAWDKAHPEEAAQWIPIQDCLPGGKHDGLLEENGFQLKKVE